MRRKYFEGWYFKHQKDDCILCFIMGKSQENAFIQVITKDFSKTFEYPLDEYAVCMNGNQIRVGESVFTADGCIVCVKDEDMLIRGRLAYGRLTPLKTDIMGVFKYVPWMECRHGVVSMDHSLSGRIEINGVWQDFTGGRGYIESDRGTSFPKWYLWCQCNSFDTKIAVMIAAAKIPFLGMSFTGTISSVYYHGREYRFATYLGAKVLECGKNGIVIRQGRRRLEAVFDCEEGHKLDAPSMGRMTRSIREQVNSHVQFKMYVDGVPFFNIQSDSGCVEYVAPTERIITMEPIEI